MKEQLCVGLDLGSSRIRLAVGQVGVLPERRPSLTVLGGVDVASNGFSKGSITSLDDAVSAISECLERAERILGLSISEATVGVGGTSVTSHRAKGIVGVSRPEGDIRAEDIDRALEAAKTCVNPANQEILHVLPSRFSVDGQAGIKDPLGMHGIRLEVDAQIIQGLASHIRNVTNAVFRTGLDIRELVYAPLAAAEAVTIPRQRDVGVCVLSIGAATSGLVVYEDGDLLHAATLPIGADHITSDLAIGLRASLEAAERIKCEHGRADADAFPKRGEEIDLSPYGATQNELVPVKYIAEIIQARVEEIYERVEQELRSIDRSGMLPAGVLLTGGGSKLAGMVEVGKRMLRLPCALGRLTTQSPMSELTEDASMSTAIGLVLWSFENARREESTDRGSVVMHRMRKSVGKLFKSFLPW